MRLLDLFCGAGMASDGYAAAGFDEIVGVDINPQPHYPYEFIQTDAVGYLSELVWSHDIDGFDAIHASPPCQAFTRASHLRTAQGGVSKYADFLTPTLNILRDREIFICREIPWVVENVPGAPGMDDAVVECGSAYGLKVQRHRKFLSNVPLVGSGCDHASFELDPITGKPRPWGVYHVMNDKVPSGGRTVRDLPHGLEVMGVSRTMPWNSLKEGFPPAYTKHIGRQLLAQMAVRP